MPSSPTNPAHAFFTRPAHRLLSQSLALDVRYAQTPRPRSVRPRRNGIVLADAPHEHSFDNNGSPHAGMAADGTVEKIDTGKCSNDGFGPLVRQYR